MHICQRYIWLDHVKSYEILMFVCFKPESATPPAIPSQAATADDTFTPSRTDSSAVFSQETEFYTALYTWLLRQQDVMGTWGGGLQQTWEIWATYGVDNECIPKEFPVRHRQLD